MCGIVGYIGERQSLDVLLDGLRRLEYRGYDSAGVALLVDGAIEVRRKKGKLKELEKALGSEKLSATLGVGHTRWATHGRPSDENAHPHKVGAVALVHNGIIENYRELKKELVARGRTFTSETDTEIVAHLVDEGIQKGQDLETAFRATLKRLQGTYSLVCLSAKEPGKFMAARRGSPLVVGYGKGESFVASDVAALLPYTRSVSFVDDNEVVVATRAGITISDIDGKKIERAPRTIDWSPSQAERGGYRHFMLKEIHEQPRALADTLTGRIAKNGVAGGPMVILDGMGLSADDARRFRKVLHIACGTSWHASQVGRWMIEEIARIPVDVDLASEFRMRDPLVDKDTLCVFVSQSGETIDTLGAMREAKTRGAYTLAICNVVDSTIAREADGVIYTHAGPEIGVASTKAFSTQLAIFYLLALWLADARKSQPHETLARLRDDLVKVPMLVDQTLAMTAEPAERIARDYVKSYTGRPSMLYLGRGPQHPIALEGALKLKEISYIHAEGYAAGEMKHGPIALIDEGMPVVVLAPHDRFFEKTSSNMQEVRARGGFIIAVATSGEKSLEDVAQEVLFVPEAPELISAFLTVVPLQLLAYHIAVLKGTDVDQPRNLAKSVTVE
ncbi:MAG TPA: glutamine--fructose-6-phosphate transaminase (isomerizing) [bacterium]|nr:glutamine--fructose-6-phosphate transaminase (isomerizing) [bacterium]